MGLVIDCERVRGELVGFLGEGIRSAGFERAVVGLSGGVDSATSASLAVQALGAENVACIAMPYRTSAPESLADAQTVAGELGVELAVEEITTQVDAYFERHPDASQIRRGNKMARERMSILFDHSARLAALVVGTSNKTETLLGYGTLFGDTACGINPLGDLYKTQVLALAGHVGVPERVVTKPPSADLWHGQTDEEELGFAYEDVDRLLHAHVDEGMDEAALTQAGFDGTFVRRVMEMIGRFEYKRRPAPVAKLAV